MTNDEVLFRTTEKCDIYFENSLISKELIVKKYADFFVSSISGDSHSFSVALHTGSVIFEIVSFITAALACVALDKTGVESIVSSLNEGDMVLFRGKRYHWRGLNIINGTKCIILEQDGSGKNGNITTIVPYDVNKNLIIPYYGTSDVTDGRGIRQKNGDRADFISHILGINSTDVPSVTGVSAVIVTERENFERLIKGVQIVYGNGKSIGLLDIVTASYFSDSGEEYPYGNNPSKNEPVLKITRKISTARDLVLDKYGNRTVGLLVIGTDAVSKGNFELIDLLGRKSLNFVHIATGIDSECAEEIIEMREDAVIFAVTKEFLLQNSLPPKEINEITLELDGQIENILNNTVEVEIVEGGCSWEEVRKIRESLYVILKSEWNDDAKNAFIISAYSLLNLFTTAIFPIETLEKAVKDGKLRVGVKSPDLRIRELWDIADKAESVQYQCAYVADVLEMLYKSGYSYSQKYIALKRHLESSNGRKIAIVVPKAYYIDILCENETFCGRDVTIITANRFDRSIRYDEIIVVGDFRGNRFDPLKSMAAEKIMILLYECETHGFKHRKHKAGNFEKKLNSILGFNTEERLDDGVPDTDSAEIDELDTYIEMEVDLEHYIYNISKFEISKYVAGVSGSPGNTLTAEVSAIGHFVGGERILFSKYYKAVVLDIARNKAYEVDADDLSVGDRLIFAKRDDYTKNMVDYIYENLRAADRLSADILDATEKASYWKKVLREYQVTHNLSYRDIARGLQKLGSSLQEVAVRQWLVEESRIVGPREEVTLRQIAELTQDSYLLEDTHSYFEACRVVRSQRLKILELIEKAIIDGLSGKKPPVGSVLEIVYDNVENLSETLELDSIMLLEEHLTVPINLINKPIMDWEVMA